MPGHCIYDEKRIGRDLGKSNVCRGEGPKLGRGGLTGGWGKHEDNSTEDQTRGEDKKCVSSQAWGSEGLCTVSFPGTPGSLKIGLISSSFARHGGNVYAHGQVKEARLEGLSTDFNYTTFRKMQN